MRLLFLPTAVSTVLSARWPARSVAASVICLVLIAGVHVPVGAQDDQTGDDAYTDADYGYGLEWDGDVWSVTTADGFDLVLGSDVSTVNFQSGAFYGGDATACRDDLIARLPGQPGILSVEPLLVNDEPVAATDPGRALATLVVTIEAEDEADDPIELAETIECRTLVEGEAILAITSFSPIASYERSAGETAILLNTLSIPDFAPAGTLPEGIDGNQYVDPELGFSLSWDEAIWQPYQLPGYTLGLATGTSFLLVQRDTGDVASTDACLDAAQSGLEDAPGITSIEPLAATNGSSGAWQFDGYQIALGEGAAAIEQFTVFGCAEIVPGEVYLGASHTGPLTALEQETQLAASVFESLDIQATVGPIPTVGESPELDLAEPLTYENVDAGWQLTYDGTIWLPGDPLLYAATDIALRSGPSTVTFRTTTEFGTDVDACLDAFQVSQLGVGDADGVSEVDGPLPPDISRSLVFGPDDSAQALTIGCLVLSDDALIVVRQFTNAADFDVESEKLAQLLLGLVALS